MATRTIECNIKEMNVLAGTSLNATDMIKMCNKMGLLATVKSLESIEVTIPITRSDILHACDIAEDIAIAFGYNNVPTILPNTISFGTQ